jgi:ferredoxin
MAMTEQEFKEIFRPEHVHMGKMKVDVVKCSGCGLCVDNCIFRTWEMGDDKKPRFREGVPCFSCYNCMVACPKDAISIEESYHVDSGFWKTYPNPLPAVRPLEPYSADGKPTNGLGGKQYSRQVRNFLNKAVPETLIRRVIEAGRFAPTSGNCQPFQFVVVTKKSLIDELNDMSFRIINGMYNAYKSEEGVKAIAKGYEAAPNPGGWDPRIILGGVGASVVKKTNAVLLGAPAVILIAADSRSIGGPQIQVGISQNGSCSLSLGIKANGWALLLIVAEFHRLWQKLEFAHHLP